MTWEATIRTGHPATDAQQLEQHRAHAHTQGLMLDVRPLPQGGFWVRAVSPPPVAYAQQPAPANHGGCQTCGRGAPTKNVTFLQNIGLVLVRLPKTASGAMCRFCIERHFWRFTTVTFFFGWWGVISFFYSLVTIPLNVVNYLLASKLPYPPHDAQSVREMRGRGVFFIVGGALIGLGALLWSIAGVAAMVGPRGDVAAGLLAIITSLLFMGAPAGFMLHKGVRGMASRQTAT